MTRYKAEGTENVLNKAGVEISVVQIDDFSLQDPETGDYVYWYQMCPSQYLCLDEDKIKQEPTIENARFVAYDEQKPWEEAQITCTNESGNLASVHSEPELILLSYDIGNNWYYNYYWLGHNDINEEASFQWSDNTPFDYTFWRAGQPDNNQDNEDCGSFGFETPEMQDDDCTKELPFICKFLS